MPVISTLSSDQHLPCIFAVVWGWLSMAKHSIFMICRSYGGVASGSTVIPGNFVEGVAGPAAGGRCFCSCSYQSLLAGCAVPAIPAQRRHGRTEFHLNVGSPGVAINQDVIVGLLATTTVAKTFSHNDGRSAHCPLAHRMRPQHAEGKRYVLYAHSC